ncbi:MAG: M48 family metalloprotease, partial [Myxococcales bacterium]|nr:M48 family metalloprotease [Myxococcales bacterium]
MSRTSPSRLRNPLLALSLAVLASGCGTLSVQQERALGEQFILQTKREVDLFSERVVVDYVDQIGRLVLSHSPPQPFAFEFYVVEDENINAFAGPGGYIFVNTGTILKARNLSELAGVIAHEIGHVVERHVAENYNRQRAAGTLHKIGVYTAAIVGGALAANAMNLGGGLAAMAVLNTFGRDAEREADEFAVETLVAAGIDPSGIVSFFELLAREGGPGAPAFLSSHPAPVERVENTREQIEDLGPLTGLRTTDGGRLEIIQR